MGFELGQLKKMENVRVFELKIDFLVPVIPETLDL